MKKRGRRTLIPPPQKEKPVGRERGGKRILKGGKKQQTKREFLSSLKRGRDVGKGRYLNNNT